jgi:hypothetical protein
MEDMLVTMSGLAWELLIEESMSRGKMILTMRPSCHWCKYGAALPSYIPLVH